MIRLAKHEDLDAILAVYRTARSYMRDNGNPTQWGDAYPARGLLEEDIRQERLYVDVEDGVIHGAFVFIIGADPTYSVIENGAWKNDEPYGTIHRIAGDGAVKGVFARCLEFSKERMDHLRIDTHADNHTMQHLVTKHGFQECGTIYVEDGSPRIAYQYMKR